jgi:hypothetical protein
MDFYDEWDFDPKPFNSGSGRPVFAEIKVRVANALLPGKSFKITSVKVPVSQTSADEIVTWSGGTPKPVLDRASKDVGAGDTGEAQERQGEPVAADTSERNP